MKKLFIAITIPFLLWSCGETVNPQPAENFEPKIKVSAKKYTCGGSNCEIKTYIIFYDNDTRIVVNKEKFEETNIGDTK